MPAIKTIWPILLLASAAALAAAQEDSSANDPSDDAIAVADEADAADDPWVVVDEPEDGMDDIGDDDDEVASDDDSGSQRPIDRPTQDRTPQADGRFLPPPPDLPVVARRRQIAAAAGAAETQNAGNARTTDADGGRSYGGEQVKDGGAPWQVEIFLPFPADKWQDWARKGKELWELQHWCGGALIARDWVLTAAHCVDMKSPPATAYNVRVGAEDISRDKGIVFKVDRAVVHPGFAARNKDDRVKRPFFDDIALLHIVPVAPTPTSLDPKQVQEISFHRGPPPGDREPVSVTGWGKTQNVDGTKPSAVLMRVDLNVVGPSTCAGLPDYGSDKIHAGVFCAGAPEKKTCRGDSGGPVVFTNGKPVVVGIVSWGMKECTRDGQPGVYTRVAAYSQWIDSTIRPTRP